MIYHITKKQQKHVALSTIVTKNIVSQDIKNILSEKVSGIYDLKAMVV